MTERRRTLWGNFAWVSPAPLIASVNDKIVKGIDDVVSARRQRWVAEQRRLTAGDFRVCAHPDGDDLSFLIIGDPGEADASQFAVVAPLLAEGKDSSFMVIASDIVYPAGDINDYPDHFYLPYRDYPKPIYAIPGNHDWYDGLNGFMWAFCGAEALPPTAYRASSYGWRGRIARGLWRKAAAPERTALVRARDARPPGPSHPPTATQPGPYFAIETKRLIIVCIDTGITGKLDREQGGWLRRVSKGDHPKILVTGKPIYVDGEYCRGEIEWGDEKDTTTVDDIVRDPDHHYVAAIGGDVHNYQRYTVRLPDGAAGAKGGGAGSESAHRAIEYIVSGGGGAYLSATHRIPRVCMRPPGAPPGSVPAVNESDFHCYPLRGDSLARFTLRFGRTMLLAFVAALLIVATSAGALVLWRAATVSGHAVWEQMAVVVALTVALVAAVRAATGLARTVRGRYARLACVILASAGLAGAVLVAVRDMPVAARWIAEVIAVTLLVVLVPLLAVAVYYARRGARPLPAAVLVQGALVVGVAVFFAWTLAPSARLGLPATLILSFASLAVVVPVIGWCARTAGERRRACATEELRGDEETARRRRRAWGAAVGGWRMILVGLAAAPLAYTWPDQALLVLVSAWGLVLEASLFLLAWERRVVCAPLRLWCSRLDPDVAARYMADCLEPKGEPVREKARVAEPTKSDLALARVIHRTRWLNGFISEIAEATRPPFFKSFLKVEVRGEDLHITCYGVTGYAEDESAPSVEDQVAIPLGQVPDPRRDASTVAVREAPSTA